MANDNLGPASNESKPKETSTNVLRPSEANQQSNKQAESGPTFTRTPGDLEGKLKEPFPLEASKTDRETRWTNRTSLIASLIGIIAVFAGMLFWFDSKLNNLVEQRIEPYENFSLGVGFVQDEAYDKAVLEFDAAFDKLKKRLEEQNRSKERLLPVIDYYLNAIANSSGPIEHSHRLNKVRELFEKNDISPNGYHYQQIGWYYLRVGKLKEARENLSRATDSYRIEGLPRSAADGHWGLALVNLAEGNMDLALNEAQEASRKNPRRFEIEVLLRDAGAMKEETFYKGLISAYPGFQSSFDAFLKS